jgi:polyhydroxyalkanoic acid synthase PhaR subunit
VTKKSFMDPFQIWKSLYDQTESKWNDLLHETMQKEAFSELMGQVQNGYLQFQKFVQHTAEAYLKQVNIPTRDEMSSIASLIINLENKVDDLDQKIEDELSEKQTSSEIVKLKASIAKLDKKLDVLLKAVQAVEEPVGKATRPVENK